MPNQKRCFDCRKNQKNIFDEEAVVTRDKINRNMLDKNVFLIVIKVKVSLIVIKITAFYNQL